MGKKENRQQRILEWLEMEPSMGFSECFSRYAEKYSLSERTFATDWKVAKERHEEIVRAKHRAFEATAVAKHLENLADGLETRTERIMRLQDQVQEITVILQQGIVMDTFVVNGAVKKYERGLTIPERRMLWTSLRDLQQEISKMEGDYAPEKHIVQNGDGYVIELPSNNR